MWFLMSPTRVQHKTLSSVARGLICLWLLIHVSNIGHISVAEAAPKCETTLKIKQKMEQTLPIDTRVPDRFRLFPLLAFVEILWALLTACNHARFSTVAHQVSKGPSM